MNSTILQGDSLHVLRTIPENHVHTVVTSPPYFGLRDYGNPPTQWPAMEYQTIGGKIQLEAMECCLGAEEIVDAFIGHLVLIFREVHRVLRRDGTVWLNIGDSHNAAGRKGHGTRLGHKQMTNRASANRVDQNRSTEPSLKPKDLIGVPWRLAFALQAEGWFLRQDIIWAKANPMPESVKDRCTKAHEYLFLFSKKSRYYYDAFSIQHRGSNKRDVWEIATEPLKEKHFAPFPTKLIEPCILAGTSSEGCCGECGAPLARKFEKTSSPDPKAKGSRFDKGKTGARDGGDRTQEGDRFISQPAGWYPTCECSQPSIPCTVLDIFSGSGTTGLVANRLGRSYIGIEYSHEFVAISRRRIEEDRGMFASITVVDDAAKTLPLFPPESEEKMSVFLRTPDGDIYGGPDRESVVLEIKKEEPEVEESFLVEIDPMTKCCLMDEDECPTDEFVTLEEEYASTASLQVARFVCSMEMDDDEAEQASTN